MSLRRCRENTHTISLARIQRLRLQCRHRHRLVQLSAHVIISRRHIGWTALALVSLKLLSKACFVVFELAPNRLQSPHGCVDKLTLETYVCCRCMHWRRIESPWICLEAHL